MLSATFLYLGPEPISCDPDAPASGTHRSATNLVLHLASRGVEIGLAGRWDLSGMDGALPVRPVTDWADANPLVLVAASASALAAVGDSGASAICWLQNPYRYSGLRASVEAGTVQSIVVPSRWHADVYVESAVPVRVAANLVYPPGFRCPITEPDDTERSFLYVGALVPDKGLADLLAAWGVVEPLCPRADLRIAGSPQLHAAHLVDSGWIAEVERAVEAYPRARFLGALGLAELSTAIADCTAVVVNPKAHGSPETFCNAAAESLVNGRPFVGGYHGALPELVVTPVLRSLLVRSTSELARVLVRLGSVGTRELARLRHHAYAAGARHRDAEATILSWLYLLAEGQGR
jgi:glycosyltransferase involved in cell wall biosynthesis